MEHFTSFYTMKHLSIESNILVTQIWGSWLCGTDSNFKIQTYYLETPKNSPKLLRLALFSCLSKLKKKKKKNLTLQILTKKFNVGNFNSQGTLDADADEWN